MGQVPVLYVVPLSGYIEKDLRIEMRRRLDQKIFPQYIMTVDRIPRNKMKKTDRKALKQMWEEQRRVTIAE